MQLLTWHGHKKWVDGVAYSPNGKRLATASLDKMAKVWDVEDHELIAGDGGGRVHILSLEER